MFFPGANLIEGRGSWFFRKKMFVADSKRNCGELLYRMS
jgi:hypothetical protein